MVKKKIVMTFLGLMVIGGMVYYVASHLTPKSPKPVVEKVEKEEKLTNEEVYQKLVDAYGNYFYLNEETPGILTEEIINNMQLGVMNPSHGFQFGKSEETPNIYYAYQDLNQDGYDECIFSSKSQDASYNTEVFEFYDIWTRNDDTYFHVLPGYYRHVHWLCEDGCIMEYGSGSAFDGGYEWIEFDSEGNQTIVDSYAFDETIGKEEMEEMLAAYKEKHPIVDHIHSSMPFQLIEE